MRTRELPPAEKALRAYCAGIVDGEAYIGCVRLMPTPANKMTSPKYSIRIAIAMCDLEPVEAVASLLSIEDRIFIRNRRSKPHHSQVFVLEIREQNAITLLRMVMPFLRGKKQQAQTMCEFYAFKKTSRKYRTKTGRTLKFKGGPAGWKKLHHKVFERFLSQKMRCLLHGTATSVRG